MTEEHEKHHEHKEHKSEEHKPEGHKEHHQKKQNDDGSLEISKLALWKTATAVLAVLLVISVYTGGFGTGSSGSDDGTGTQQAVVAQPRGGGDAPSPSVDMDALVDDDTIKGDSDAPVTIVEWSDFECPYCTRFYTQTFGQIDEQYIKTGKVKMVFRDFPLSFHTNAQKAAEAAECAGEQGKFWEMHNALFDNGVSGGVSSFKQFAEDLGLNTADFNDCLDSNDMASEVAKDMQDGQAAGIRGTPGFVINGKLVSGAQPFSVFQQIIEAELQK